MSYRSCLDIEQCHICFNGRVDADKGFRMSFCCEFFDCVPEIYFEENAKKTAERFFRLREGLIAASKAEKLSTLCVTCPHFQLGQHGNADGLIHLVALSTYPAPCQCRCIYCKFHTGDYLTFIKSEAVEQGYNKLFDFLEYLKEKRFIAKDAIWVIASGEITIHPYKKRILDLVKGQKSGFLTNCFIFDEMIAENLRINQTSYIFFSIDAGTPQTWQKIKGFDNFHQVTDNLAKYRHYSTSPEQIYLKYILLPGINNNLVDYHSLVEIMKSLDVPELTIARDYYLQYSATKKEHEQLVLSAAYLIAVLNKNDKGFNFHNYLPFEQETIVKIADELRRLGKV